VGAGGDFARQFSPHLLGLGLRFRDRILLHGYLHSASLLPFTGYRRIGASCTKNAPIDRNRQSTGRIGIPLDGRSFVV
jgi:hypothetical protein